MDDWDAESARLAARALADGRPTAWFEELYAAGAREEITMPWDRTRPSALPADWLTGSGTGRGNPLITDPTDFFLDVHTFVLYATEDGSWTEQQSEDRLDLLEKSIADVIKDANDSGLWESVTPNGQSEIDGLELGGQEYRHEVIPVRIVVQDF